MRSVVRRLVTPVAGGVSGRPSLESAPWSAPLRGSRPTSEGLSPLLLDTVHDATSELIERRWTWEGLMGRSREVYESAIRLYNAGDLEGFADAHAKDAVLVTPLGVTRGRDAIREYWSRQRMAFPDLTLAVDFLVEQDDVVATEWTWAGTNTGPLVQSGSQVPPSGKRVEHRGMELAIVKDGKITEYRMYWDRMEIARQLGRPSQRANRN